MFSGAKQEGSNPFTRMLDSLVTGPAPQVPQYSAEARMEDHFQDAWEMGYQEQAEQAWQASSDLNTAWEEAQLDQAWQASNQVLDNQQRIQQSTDSIKSALMDQRDAKFMNSKFYKFISGLNDGSLQIEEESKQLLAADPVTGEMVEADETAYEDAWAEAEQEEWMRIWNDNIQQSQAVTSAVSSSAPASAESARQYGRDLMARDQDAEAITYLNSALELDPYDLDTILTLATACINEKQGFIALQHLQSWLANNPEYTMLVEHPVTAAEQLIGVYEQAIVQNPNDATLYKAIGLLYYMQRNTDLAMSSCQRALELQPNDPETLNRLGSFLLNSGNTLQAIETYTQAIALDPSMIRGLVNLGKAYGNNLDYQSAATCYLQALTQAPEVETTWNLLFSAFNGMNRPDLIEKWNTTRNPEDFSDEF